MNTLTAVLAGVSAGALTTWVLWRVTVRAWERVHRTLDLDRLSGEAEDAWGDR